MEYNKLAHRHTLAQIELGICKEKEELKRTIKKKNNKIAELQDKLNLLKKKEVLSAAELKVYKRYKVALMTLANVNVV